MRHLIGIRMEICAIVIPVYKERLYDNELLSFQQGCKMFKNYRVTLVTHKNLDVTFYMSEAERYNCSLKIEYFNKDYFASVAGYNKMMYSLDFYKRFSEFEYMLIYQTDAFVFRDELKFWCSKGYDYIGAPIYTKANKTEYTDEIEGIGNGGFCLRKPSYCQRILELGRFWPFLTPRGVWKLDSLYLKRDDVKSSLLFKIRTRLFGFFKMLGVHNNINYFTTSGHVNEDYLFSIYANLSWLSIKLPNIEEAAKFSVEMKPSYWMKRNDNKLPFGCHAFEKYEYNSFWVKYINSK